MASRRRFIGAGVGVGVAAGLATAGCASTGDSPSKVSWSEPGAAPDAASASPSVSPVSLSMAPAADAKNVSPADEVVVSADGGTLKTVSVTADGKTVEGKLDGDQRTWRSTGKLEYDTAYTVSVTAVDETGTTTEKSTTFTTVKPKSTATAVFRANALTRVKTGDTYGVGQVVMVHFSEAVKSRDEAEKGMTVETEPAVEGRWRWIDSRNAWWRPEKYWQSGTRINVTVDLYGKDLGNGVYGGPRSRTNFTIGPSRIAIADGRTKHMKVYIDGKMVRDIPISMGKGGTVTTSTGGTINYTTRSGVHVIMTREKSHRMSSASYGITDPEHPEYYDEVIQLCLRITYSGEFVHMADWNIWAHGKQNTSHGCINVGPSNAKWFYDTFGIGDVVDVKGTNRQMALGDGAGGAWTIPWNKW